MSAAKNKVYMILFIAENFSERQHLASVRSCFHPVQQLDWTQQHKAMNQLARVTQRVNASFQIRPQESLTPCVPKISHIRDRVQQLLLTPMDFSVTFFLFVFRVSKFQRIILSHFFSSWQIRYQVSFQWMSKLPVSLN